jgi:hypothetical protein
MFTRPLGELGCCAIEIPVAGENADLTPETKVLLPRSDRIVAGEVKNVTPVDHAHLLKRQSRRLGADFVREHSPRP